MRLTDVLPIKIYHSIIYGMEEWLLALFIGYLIMLLVGLFLRGVNASFVEGLNALGIIGISSGICIVIGVTMSIFELCRRGVRETKNSPFRTA
jgi:hypothetical protein